MATITIRTDEAIKKALQEKAKQLGISLNQFINLSFRYILNSNKLIIDLEDDIRWNEQIEKAYNEAVEEFKKGEALIIDPQTIKSEKEFLDLLEQSNV
jgi:antitoxin component of RelBE/YafQ-DinJ toxin-antitoxin module